jgi:fibronectin-binding autotransporter adhesin
VVYLEHTFVDNRGGTIAAIGHNANVVLVDSTIVGGTLESSHGGAFEIAWGTSTVNNLTIAGGTVLITSGGCHPSTLDLKGTITVGVSVTFEGAGKFTLVDGAQIVGDAGALHNYSLITGAGEIGDGTNDLKFVNEHGSDVEGPKGQAGTVDANVDHKKLILDTGTNKIINGGVLEATNGGILDIKSDIDNRGGTIKALDPSATASVVDIDGSTVTGGGIDAFDHGRVKLIDATIKDSTLSTGSHGLIETVLDHGDSSASTFVDVTITCDSQVVVKNGTSLTLQDSIHSDGVITLKGASALYITLSNDDSAIGTINDTGFAFVDGNPTPSAVYAEGTETLNHGIINIGSNADGGASLLWNYDPSGHGATLTFGSDLTINLVGTGGIYSTSGDPDVHDEVVSYATINAESSDFFVIQPDYFTNYGQINAGAADGTLDIIPTSWFKNYGTVAISNGEDVTIGDGVVVLGPDEVQRGGVTNEKGGLISVGGDSFLSIGDGSPSAEKDGLFINKGTLTADGGTADVTGPVHNSGQMDATLGGTIEIDGRLRNSGTVAADKDGTVELDAHVHNKSGGEILADGDNAQVEFLGDSVRNQGTFDADHHGTLLFDGATVRNASGFINAEHHGVIELTDGATIIDGTINVHDNSTLDVEGTATLKDVTVNMVDPGTIDVGETTTGSILYLDDATIIGGTVATVGSPYDGAGGMVEISSSGGKTVFDGSDGTLTVEGFVEEDAGAKLELKGHIELDSSQALGIIQLARGADSKLLIDGTVTLTGDGYIALEGSGSNIVAASEDATLDNESNIFGGGNIGHNGDGSLTFDNSKLVDATDGDAAAIVIDTGTTTVNTGTLEATAASELDLYGTYDNRGGTINASAEGLTPEQGFPQTAVKLFDATIQGGTLLSDDPTSSQGGMIEIVAMRGDDDPNMSVFDGSHNHAVTVDAYVNVDSGANLELLGTIHNQGTINVDGDATTDLLISGTVKLDGAGTITLDGSSDQIAGTGDGGGTLDNVDNIISGAGKIGDGSDDLTFKNEGTVNADLHGHTLAIETGGNQITNTGTLEATNDGILHVGVHGDDGSINNAGGVLFAGVGSLIDVADAITGGKGTIQGGTLEFDAISSVNVTFDNGAETPKYGELVFGNSASALDYSGKIDGFAGTSPTVSDKIDLVGINPEDVSYAKHGGNTVVTITVGDDTNKITLDGFTGSLDITSDGGTGTLISDPPATTVASADAGGSLTITDGAAAPATAIQVDPNTPVVAAVTDVDGTISEFMLGNDQINLAPGQTATDTHNNVTAPDPAHPGATVNTVSVTVGGPGNDNFVFAPGIGADTITNFNPQADTIELNHFANVQNTQQLAAAITTDAHGDAVIDLGHSDSITVAGVSGTYLQQHLQSMVHLH